jgi:hypothetical protein
MPNIIQFDYVQPGHRQHVIGRAIKVRDMQDEPLALSTLLYGKEVNRDRYLTTVAMTDGRVKSFYYGKMHNLSKVGRLRRALLWLAGIRYGRA